MSDLDHYEIIRKSIKSSRKVKKELLQKEIFYTRVSGIVDLCVNALRNGNKILWCGNGGSAADAQHLAAELSGRFYKDRPGLYSEALHTNTSYITAVANDYSYDKIYSRLINAIGQPGDILFCLSTSGKSMNIVDAVSTAKLKDMKVIGLTGHFGGLIANKVDILIDVPSKDTPRIQECHIMIGHIICELIEKEMFPDGV